MLLHTALALSPDSTLAVIGAGGKTTALWLLAQERRAAGRAVLVTTSTHIMQPEEGQCDLVCAPADAHTLSAACAPSTITCALYPAASGKCTGLSPALFAEVRGLHPLYEADGSKRLPAKLHAAHEPVIHPNTDQILLVAGLRALGKPIRTVCHRYALSPRMAADRLFDCTDLLETLRDGIAACGLPQQCIRILLNQADTPEIAAAVQPVLQTLRGEGFHIIAGSLYACAAP